MLEIKVAKIGQTEVVAQGDADVLKDELVEGIVKALRVLDADDAFDVVNAVMACNVMERANGVDMVEALDNLNPIVISIYEALIETQHEINKKAIFAAMSAKEALSFLENKEKSDRPTAEWTHTSIGGEWECSNCKSQMALSDDVHGHPNFCPQCGAEMVGSVEQTEGEADGEK